jgi:hypothetical protein
VFHNGDVVTLLSAKFCLFRISIFLALICVLALLLFNTLKNAFLYNIQINSVILLSFFTGIILIYHRIFLYEREYEKLLLFAKLKKEDIENSQLIAPVAFYISKSNNLISQTKLQTIMASLEKRVENCSVLPKYISGILIFLGLLGTFWGLSHTIGNVADIIDSLGINQSDSKESFISLKNSLKIPLSGMGIAFGCSLFGLSCSLILGFLNMNQKKVAEDFLDMAEAWLAKHTVSFDLIDNGQEYHGHAFSMALLEKTIEAIYTFQNQMMESEGNRNSILNMQKELSLKLSQLTESVLMHQELIKTIGNGQLELRNAIVSISKKLTDTVWHEILNKLGEIEFSINIMAQGEISNRTYIVDNLGKEIRIVSKTLSSLMRDK